MQRQQTRQNLAGAAALILATVALAQLPGCDNDKDPRPTSASATDTDADTAAEDSAGDTESCPETGEGSGTGDTGATSQAGSCGDESGETPTTGDGEPVGGQCEGEQCAPEMEKYCAKGLTCVRYEVGSSQCRLRCDFKPGECGGDPESCKFAPIDLDPNAQPYCDARPGMCGDQTTAPR